MCVTSKKPATPQETLRDPLRGRDPQFGNHCYRPICDGHPTLVLEALFIIAHFLQCQHENEAYT